MRALVTGGTGFTGMHLVRELLDQGHDVTVVDVERGDPLEIDPLEKRGARIVIGSVDDPAVLETVVPGHDVVFNLASAFRDIHQGAPLFQRVDVEGTRELFRVAMREGVARVVHCSTQGVHGSLSPDQTPGDESTPVAPIDYYCEAKADAEAVCQEFIDDGMDIVIVRPASIYGPGDTHGWLKLFRLCRKGRFPMLGLGRTRNHPVYVENLAHLFLLAAETPEARGRTYIAGDDASVTLEELVRLVGEVQGRDVRIIRFPWIAPVWMLAALLEWVGRPFNWEPPLFRRRLTWYTTNRAWDISRAREELGYTPRYSLREGLQRTREWYEQRGYL